MENYYADKININKSSPVPVYEQIAYEIIRLRNQGFIQAGGMLKGLRELARELGLGSPNTVRAAYDLLVQSNNAFVQNGVWYLSPVVCMVNPVYINNFLSPIVLKLLESGKRPDEIEDNIRGVVSIIINYPDHVSALTAYFMQLLNNGLTPSQIEEQVTDMVKGLINNTVQMYYAGRIGGDNQ